MEYTINDLLNEFEDKLTLEEMKEALREKVFEVQASKARVRCCGVTGGGKRCKKQVCNYYDFFS